MPETEASDSGSLRDGPEEQSDRAAREGSSRLRTVGLPWDEPGPDEPGWQSAEEEIIEDSCPEDSS